MSKQQEEVLTTHETLKDHIGKNLQQLDEEKTMIQTGQVLLTSMTEEIRKQLGMNVARVTWLIATLLDRTPG